MIDYMDFPLDHGGHADCFVTKFPDLFRFTKSKGWFFYIDGYWNIDGAEAALGRAVEYILRERHLAIKKAEWIEDDKSRKSMLKQCSVSAPQVKSVITLLKSRKEIGINLREFDQHKDKFNCQNGVIELPTGNLLAHSPNYFFTHKSDIEYKKDATNETWSNFLGSLHMPDNVIEYMKCLSGYGLTGLTDEEVMFYLYGATRTGKGTFTNALLGVMGEYGMGINFRTFTAKRDGDTQNFDLAILSPKRFLSASESKRNERINSSVFKQVTGGDPVFASLKGKDGFSFIPQWKVMLSSNYPLNADPMDAAVWARVRVLKFTDSKLGKEDKSLKRKLSTPEAKQAILSWIVSGSVSWFENGLNTPEQVEVNTRRMRLEASSVLIFIDQCCTLNIDATSNGKAIYSAYVDWCHGEGYKPYGRTSFTQSLEQVGCYSSVKKDSGKATRYYTHIEFSGESMGDQSISKRIELGLF